MSDKELLKIYKEIIEAQNVIIKSWELLMSTQRAPVIVKQSFKPSKGSKEQK